MATAEDLHNQTDTRLYDDMDGPLTEESGPLMFDTMVEMAKSTGRALALQLFTRDNRIVQENVGLLCNGLFDNPENEEWRVEVCTNHKTFNAILASIRNSGVGYSCSKHNVRREIRLYDEEPREFLRGLPLRKFRDHMVLLKTGEHQLHKDSLLAPFFDAARAKGLSIEKATKEAMAEFHASQGRARETVKGGHRPLANCACCNKRENQKERHKACAACKMVFYCCKDCQKANWGAHKAFCKANRV